MLILKSNVLMHMQREIAAVRQNPAGYLRRNLPLIVGVLLVVTLFAVAVAPSFAQTYTLDIDTEEMKANLFDGANVIVAALGAVMFLLAGFKLGGILIRGIVDTIGGIRF